MAWGRTFRKATASRPACGSSQTLHSSPREARGSLLLGCWSPSSFFSASCQPEHGQLLCRRLLVSKLLLQCLLEHGQLLLREHERGSSLLIGCWSPSLCLSISGNIGSSSLIGCRSPSSFFSAFFSASCQPEHGQLPRRGRLYRSAGTSEAPCS